MSSAVRKTRKANVLRIVILNFLLHPAIVIGISMISTIFTVDRIVTLATSWVTYLLLSPFLLGMPIVMKRELDKIDQLKKENDLKGLGKSYRFLHVIFIVTTSIYGIIGAPLGYALGFDTKIVAYISYMGLTYPPLACPISFIIFNKAMDAFFSDTDFSGIFTMKAKAKILAVFSSIGGLFVLIVSAYFLIDQLVVEPDTGLTVASTFYRLLFIALILIFFQIAPNILTANGFSKSFLAISKFIEKLKNKDLTGSISTITSRDELGRTAVQLNELKDNLVVIIDELGLNASYSRQSGDNLSGVSKTNLELASRLATGSEEVAATLEEVSSNLHSSVDIASKSASINKTSEQSMLNAQKLSNLTVQSIKKIAEKVELIDSIAAQTNLLAINAFIEASNAGEHGKGFSVVAQEIRSLADNSAQAAKSISSTTEQCIANSGESQEIIDESVLIAQQTSELAVEIEVASKEQLTSIENINSAIQGLSSSAQVLAASSEKLTTTSDGFRESSKKVDQLIKGFKF